jgi:peptidoglycan/xylan/chitin deacetylase (PgdA/CDA1 family)
MKGRVIAIVMSFFCAIAFSAENIPDSFYKKRQEIVELYKNLKPKIFSEYVPGVKRRINTSEKIIAITLDACGGKKGNGYDRELIEFFRQNKIPATLFMTSLWIDANEDIARELARDPLFEIENHGYRHKPASVNGAVVYRRRGTISPEDLFDEIELNALKIERLTGKKPIFYRPGTAYFDDVAVRITYSLNYIPMNFSLVSGDAAGLSSSKIAGRILKFSKNGTVIIAHMNRPGRGLCAAFEKSLPVLKKRGFKFVKLSDYKDKLQ